MVGGDDGGGDGANDTIEDKCADLFWGDGGGVEGGECSGAHAKECGSLREGAGAEEIGNCFALHGEVVGGEEFWWAGRVSMSKQVDADDGVLIGEALRKPCLAFGSHGVAMEQEEWRAAALT